MVVSSFAVYQLIRGRRFDLMAVLEGQNILVTVSGKKRRIRVYYLSWLKTKILRTDGVILAIVELILVSPMFAGVSG